MLRRRVSPRLAKLARLPGGKTVGAIEAEVEARLESLKATCFATAQEKVQQLTALAKALPPAPAPEDFPPFYVLANEIVGLAGMADLAHAGRAALSLCRLLDGWAHGRAWKPAAMEVHLAAITLLVQPDCELTPAARDRIIEGLDQVARRDQVAGLTPPPSRTLP